MREVNNSAKLGAAWLRHLVRSPCHSLPLQQLMPLCFNVFGVTLLAAASQQCQKAVLHTAPPICIVELPSE